MGKHPLKLHARIPPYRGPRNRWRQQLHAVLWREKERCGIVYRPSDRLEVMVRLYLDKRSLASNDVDNRLKDVLDALQGRAGGSKRQATLAPIIPNDRQVFRVILEKSLPPKQSGGLGHVVVRRLRSEKGAT